MLSFLLRNVSKKHSVCLFSQLGIENKLEYFTLAMIELKNKHTVENLKNEILNVLKNFNIKKQQIYAITTDNGRNMVKAVELLSTHNDEEEENGSASEENYENEAVVDNMNFESIISVKCGAHTLQLAVKDFLKSIAEIVLKSREVVKTLRTPAFR